jgi:hypothetical protein
MDINLSLPNVIILPPWLAPENPAIGSPENDRYVNANRHFEFKIYLFKK